MNVFETAEKLYLKVLDKDPKNFEGQLWLGSLYSEKGQFPKAIELLEGAIEQRPTDVRPYYNLGLLQAKLKRQELAIEIFKRGLEQPKINKNRKVELLYNIGRLKIDLKDFGSAIDFANKVLAVDSKNKKAQELKMYAFERMKK